MRCTEKELRMLIREMVASPADAVHKTIDGGIVPLGCPECVSDLEIRIDDARWNRDQCSRGSATRSNYNGLLGSLRKALRAALKELDKQQLDVEL